MKASRKWIMQRASALIIAPLIVWFLLSLISLSTGDYNSVIGMNKENSINRFLKKSSLKHFPATGEASLCGSIIECNVETGLATNINQFIFGGDLKNSH